MMRGQGGRVPVPTQEQIEGATVKERQIDACSGVRHGALIYLNIAFRTGDIATVYLDEVGGVHLLAALKALVQNGESIAASRVRKGPLGSEVQEGHKPG